MAEQGEIVLPEQTQQPVGVTLPADVPTEVDDVSSHKAQPVPGVAGEAGERMRTQFMLPSYDQQQCLFQG